MNVISIFRQAGNFGFMTHETCCLKSEWHGQGTIEGSDFIPFLYHIFGTKSIESRKSNVFSVYLNFPSKPSSCPHTFHCLQKAWPIPNWDCLSLLCMAKRGYDMGRLTVWNIHTCDDCRSLLEFPLVSVY